MPVTPFHFGPGALIKSALPVTFSWAMFALSNIVIDLEPILYYLLTGDPVHGYLHTLLGAGVLGVVTGYAGWRPCEWALRRWNSIMSPGQLRRLGVSTQLTLRVAIVSALIGTWSHVLIDSLMHVDVQLLWPFTSGNSWRGLVSLEALHWGCVISGVIGLFVLVLRRLRSPG